MTAMTAMTAMEPATPSRSATPSRPAANWTTIRPGPRLTPRCRPQE